MRSPFRTQTISRAHKRKAPALRPGPFCVGKPGSGHPARDFAAYTPPLWIPEEGACPFLHPRKRRIGGIFHPKAPALRPGPSRISKPGSGHSARDFAAYTPSMRIAEEGACPFLHPRKRRIGGILHPRPRPYGRGLRASANREAGLRLATLRPPRHRCGLPRKGVAPSGIPESGGLGDSPSEGPGLAAGAFLQPFSGGIRTALRSRPPR